MEEASWQKNHAEGIMEEHSCAGIMEKQSCTRYATQASSFLIRLSTHYFQKMPFEPTPWQVIMGYRDHCSEGVGVVHIRWIVLPAGCG